MRSLMLRNPSVIRGFSNHFSEREREATFPTPGWWKQPGRSTPSICGSLLAQGDAEGYEVWHLLWYKPYGGLGVRKF